VSVLKTPSSTATGPAPAPSARAVVPTSSADAQSVYATQMEKIPQLAALGQLFKSSPPFDLTESGTEYVVSCIKHVFAEHLVLQVCIHVFMFCDELGMGLLRCGGSTLKVFAFILFLLLRSLFNLSQFNCENTLNDALLENVTIVTTIESAGDDTASLMVVEIVMPIERLAYNQPGVAYTVFSRPGGICPTVTLANNMTFLVKDFDPSTGEPDGEEGYEDEYQVKDFSRQRA
jgi:coatomer subunit gamma